MLSEYIVDFERIFLLLADVSQKYKIHCILVGGFAVNHYKVTRQTADVDFVITKEDFDKIVPSLKKGGFTKIDILNAFAHLSSKTQYLMDLDFIFVDKETMDKMIKDGKKIDIVKKQFIVPSLNTLIALKLHSIKFNPRLRESKDLPDIINLIRINKIKYKNKAFKDLCIKYGTKALYDKIVTSL